MKTIGLIGGTSWSSTADYYRIMNEEAARRLGGLHSARLLIGSIDFAELEQAMHANQWRIAAKILKSTALSLSKAGADILLLCSNLIHKVFPEVQKATPIPMLHIGDAIATDIMSRGFTAVALLGTKPTMEDVFYKTRIREKCGAEVILPLAKEREDIDRAIFERMCRNIYTKEDKEMICDIISGLKKRGAQGVVLGCTELPVLIKKASLPLLNSTLIHSLCAMDWALGKSRASFTNVH